MLVTARDNEVFSPAEETDLINAVRAGDLDAYGLIYRRHAAAALACALSHCRSQRRRIEDHLAACAGCAKLSAMLCCINSTMARNRAPHGRRTR
jgi:hypothetical protein